MGRGERPLMFTAVLFCAFILQNRFHNALSARTGFSRKCLRQIG